jgi:predicted CoA-binding protein
VVGGSTDHSGASVEVLSLVLFTSMTVNPPLDELRRIYAESRVVAVVGASPDPSKKAHAVPSYLQDIGYRIIPVNPYHDEIFGEPSYPTLMEVAESVDVVEVFRPSEDAPQIARLAAVMGAKVLWLQKGIVSEEAAQIAKDAGLTFVSDLCMGATHALLELGPAPSATD